MAETNLTKKVFTLLATGFGLGYLPYAPGTWGTLLGVVLALILAKLPLPVHFAAVILSIILAVHVANFYEKNYRGHDRKEVVIDEIAGYLVATAFMPITFNTMAISFIVFRILDVVKPFPISYIDRNIKNGFGVVFDDVLAGIVTAAVIKLLLPIM